MKKAQHFREDRFRFHKQVVNAKRAGRVKDTLKLLEPRIEKSYVDYDRAFECNQLSTLHPISITTQEKKVLKDGLYQFGQKAFGELFISLTTTASGLRDMLCPNCTLMDCTQLDHYIPKSIFPEFAANPCNLMQCCSKCNQMKLDRWLEGGQPIFLNLYLDNIPQEQYLFTSIIFNGNIPKVEFHLQNSANIETTLFSRIESHYRELDLCARFAEKADSVISEILREYISAKDEGIDTSQLRNFLKSKARLEQQRFGFNYWKAILILELCCNSDFCRYIETADLIP